MPKGLMIAIGKMKPGSKPESGSDSHDVGLESAFDELVSALGLSGVDSGEGVRALKNFIQICGGHDSPEEESEEDEEDSY